MKELIIIGVGGLAREVYMHAKASIGCDEEWCLKGFLDGDKKLPQEEYQKLKLPLLGDVNSYKIEENDVFICAVANTNIREKMVEKISSRGGDFLTLINKNSYISETAKIGKGSVIGNYVTITDNVSLGEYSFLNAYTSLGHDVIVGKYTSTMGHVDITGN